MTKKSRKPEKFVRTPGYPGGRAALSQFIQSELKYPKAALEKRIEGKVKIKFILTGEGVILEAAVLQSLGYGCDEEALRIVQLLNFTGVKNRGVRATFKKTITIPFKLKKIPAPSNMQIKYTFKEEQKQSSKSINYTIKIGK